MIIILKLFPGDGCDNVAVEELKEGVVPKPSGISPALSESSDGWMDDCVVVDLEDAEEDAKVKEEPVKVEEVKKTSGISLPMTGASDDWMDDEVGLTMDAEDDDEVKVEEPVKVEEVVTIKAENATAKNKKKKGNGKKDKTTQPDQKTESKKSEEKPKTEASSDDIDSVLDDWLNGDDEIPEDLPEINVKTEKKDVKSFDKLDF